MPGVRLGGFILRDRQNNGGVKPYCTSSAGSIFATLLSPCSCNTKSKAASVPRMTPAPYKPNPFLERTKIPLPCTSICLANSLT